MPRRTRCPATTRRTCRRSEPQRRRDRRVCDRRRAGPARGRGEDCRRTATALACRPEGGRMQTSVDFSQRLAAARPGSMSWYERAQRSIAGGIGHDARYAVPGPIYIERGEGAYKWDVDGNRYLDYQVGNGALLLGHSHPAVLEAVLRTAPLGVHFGNDHPLQVRWAELVVELVPCAERVRFVNSGTEANMLAARLARAATGRGKLLRFEGHFHGWHDELVTGFVPPFEAPPSTGLPPGLEAGTVMVPANDLELLDRTLAADRDVAAAILEPSGASWCT